MTTDAERFAANVNQTATCHLWTGATNADGYGTFTYQGKKVLAHRYAYAASLTPEGEPVNLDLIPEGELDHVRERGCTHRNCVKAEHLEPVTHEVNLSRRSDRQPAYSASVSSSADSTTPEPHTKKVRGRPFTPGDARINHAGRPRKGESMPELLKRAVERPKVVTAIVNATVNRLLREDAVGNRAFADVRDTVYGIPKQTLVLEQGEAGADQLDQALAAYLASKTVDGEAKLLP